MQRTDCYELPFIAIARLSYMPMQYFSFSFLWHEKDVIFADL
jgi:hypothetical protein